MKKIIFTLLLLCSINFLSAQIPNGWVIDWGVSDNFNYTDKNRLKQKWFDINPNGWKGPGRTKFVPGNVQLDGRNLVIKASNRPARDNRESHTEGGKKFYRDVYAGYAATKKRIKFPVYFEARIKVSNLVLASNFWAKLGDNGNKTEIDVTETYGARKESEFNMNTNYHIFRNGNASQQGFHRVSGNQPLRNGFHKFSCLWSNKNTLTFYLDGKKVRTISPSQSDAKNRMKDFSGSAFLNENLRIIFDTEEHVWLNNRGVVPTVSELNNNNRNKMLVDWLHTYRPRSGKALIGADNSDSLNAYPNPASLTLTIDGLYENDIVAVKDLNGRAINLNIDYSSDGTSTVDVSSLANGMYIAFTSQGRSIKFVKD